MSRRIVVRPGQLRQQSQHLRRFVQQLHDLTLRSKRSYYNLHADARSLAGLDARIRRLERWSVILTEELSRLARYLDAKAHAFEVADRQGVSMLAGLDPLIKQVITPCTLPDSPRINNLDLIKKLIDSVVIGNLSELYDFYQLIKDKNYLVTLLSTIYAVPATNYPGHIIYYGSEAAKKLTYIDLDETPMKINFQNTFIKPFAKSLISDVKNIMKNSFDYKLLNFNPLDIKQWKSFNLKKVNVGGALNIIGLVAGAYSDWNDNWEAYKGDSTKTTVATGVDVVGGTVFNIGGTIFGSAVGGFVLGSFLGAISGGTLAPVGIAIGSRGGAIIGGIAGNVLFEHVKDKEWYKDFKDNLGQTIKDAPAKIKGQIQELNDQVKSFFKDAPGQIVEKVKDLPSQIIGNVVDFIGQAQHVIKEIPGQIQSNIKNLPGQIEGTIKDMGDQVKQVVKDFPNQLRNVAGNVGNWINGFFGN